MQSLTGCFSVAVRTIRATCPDRSADPADDARIVLIPRTQPRPRGERVAAIAGATVLTPVAVATDVFIVGPFLLVWYTTERARM